MENIRKQIIEEYEKYTNDYIKSINEEKEKADKNESNFLDWMLQRQLTKLTFEKWKNGEIATDEAIEKAIKREIKQNAKARDNTLTRLETIENANDFYKINIIVEWTQSRTWGANPHATAEIWSKDQNGAPKYERYTGTASGCGYDKESAAIAQALNQSNAVIKAFCLYKENSIKKLKKEYRDRDNRDVICYGFGYSPIPHFEGGTGTNCFINGFKLLDCTIDETHGKASDSYIIKREI